MQDMLDGPVPEQNKDKADEHLLNTSIPRQHIKGGGPTGNSHCWVSVTHYVTQ